MNVSMIIYSSRMYASCRHIHSSIGCVYWIVPIVACWSGERTCGCSCL